MNDMNNSNIIFLFCALFILSPLATASDRPEGEYFLAAPPKDWILGRKDLQQNISTFEFIPLGETISSWTQMVTIQKLLGKKNIKPEQHLAQIAELDIDICKGFQTQQIAFENVNGYEAHGMIQSCGANRITNRGEFKIVRVVSGNENLYIIQKSWRLTPFDPDKDFPIPRAKIDETIYYLSSAIVCDTRKGTCPRSSRK